MAKRKQGAKKREQPPATPQVPKKDNLRETIESVVIALVLAFLFQAFDAQAFEIPTGSMGPTLMGRHKDVVCAECGFRYQAGASIEVNDETGEYRPNNRVLHTTCPLCRYPMKTDSDDGNNEQLSYKGDRIWVSKAPYILGDPKRFDVAVFKFPRLAHENYIKRIVGLPDETVRIHHGDLFTRSTGEDDFTIARKPPHKVLAMMHPVFDSDYLPKRLLEAGWPPRWQPEARAGSNSSRGEWTTTDGTGSFETDGTARDDVWIRYRHIVPTREDWQALDQGPFGSNDPFPPPQLIADFCAYNSGAPGDRASAPVPEPFGLHWVGDLILACQLEVAGNGGSVTLELVEGGRRFRCHLSLADGQATLSIDGIDSFKPVAKTPVRGTGDYEITFANVDDQLLLWVDGNVIEFDQPTLYEPLGNRRPTAADLAPVGIGARGAKVRVSRLRISRDIYYIAGRVRQVRDKRGNVITDFDRNPYLERTFDAERVAEFLSSPEMWGAFEQIEPEDYRLNEGEFFVLGDNSPNSSDARLWNGQRLPRELLIGKAFFIYWPHAWETNPSFEVQLRARKLRVPFYPNFSRMRRIR